MVCDVVLTVLTTSLLAVKSLAIMAVGYLTIQLACNSEKYDINKMDAVNELNQLVRRQCVLVNDYGRSLGEWPDDARDEFFALRSRGVKLAYDIPLGTQIAGCPECGDPNVVSRWARADKGRAFVCSRDYMHEFLWVKTYEDQILDFI